MIRENVTMEAHGFCALPDPETTSRASNKPQKAEVLARGVEEKPVPYRNFIRNGISIEKITHCSHYRDIPIVVSLNSLRSTMEKWQMFAQELKKKKK